MGQYSKGMQRKIGLAQALINRPQLLILDEPTSGMDPTATHDTKQLLQHLAARGTTILLCSHLLADAEELCQHVAMMYGGKIIRQGTVDELLTIRNRTTIETERLDEKAIAQIDNLLLGRGRKIESVSHPRQSLEQWFIERIREQQDQGTQTSGAVSGGKMAEFLVGPAAEAIQGKEVIGQLVRAAAPPPAEEPKPAAPPLPQTPPPDEVLLAKLLRPVKPAAPPPAEDVEFVDHLAEVEGANGQINEQAQFLPPVPPASPAKPAGPAPEPTGVARAQCGGDFRSAAHGRRTQHHRQPGESKLGRRRDQGQRPGSGGQPANAGVRGCQAAGGSSRRGGIRNRIGRAGGRKAVRRIPRRPRAGQTRGRCPGKEGISLRS